MGQAFLFRWAPPSGRVVRIADGRRIEDVDAQRRALMAAFSAGESSP